MLELKKECETCGAGLEADGEAYICSYECSYCRRCSEETHGYTCPGCGGELVRRPRRHQE
ncbi:MAG: DUF1272 domain-containing protein [Proteobacteria bacterium]|nr:DUF1272 domain-containing protein [Pseudomonadota bacterium]